MRLSEASLYQRRALALAIALTLHIALLLLLWSLYLRAPHPQTKPVEVLVAVNVGNVEQASGAIEPGGTQSEDPQSTRVEAPHPTPPVPPTPIPTPRPKAPSRTSSQPLQTQNIEQSMRIEETRRAEAEAKARAEAERRAREEAARREAQRQEIGHSVAGAFGRQSGAAGSQGTASSGTGNQGNPNGSAGSYALTGRTIVSNGGVLARPSTNRAIDGIVRVRIIVDGSGRVIQATVAQGTNIADTSVRNAALSAARATRFNAVAGADDQEGLITYRFKIQS